MTKPVPYRSVQIHMSKHVPKIIFKELYVLSQLGVTHSKTQVLLGEQAKEPVL